MKVKLRQNFPRKTLRPKELALSFARARVRDISSPLSRFTPLSIEIENEAVYLKDKKINPGLIYDGIKLVRLFEGLIATEDADKYRIILTDRLLGTFSDDRSFHLRTIICGYPVLISVPGIVEAPARPKEFYRIKHRLVSLGMWEREEGRVKAGFKDRFIDYRDKRITEVLKGLIAQALFFYMTGEPFCKIRACRLFNSHWQEDLIYSQVKKGKFCSRHQAMLRKLRIN